jgi:hypothetical protein
MARIARFQMKATQVEGGLLSRLSLAATPSAVPIRLGTVHKNQYA